MISFVLKTSPNDDVNQPNEMRRFEELSPFPSLSMLFTKISERGLRLYVTTPRKSSEQNDRQF